MHINKALRKYIATVYMMTSLLSERGSSARDETKRTVQIEFNYHIINSISCWSLQAYCSVIFLHPCRGGGKDPQLRDDTPRHSVIFLF